MTSSVTDPGFGVYVHWPFCASKCPYCDFNSHVRHQPVEEARFAAAMAREIAYMADLAPGRRVDSIFFGGGTPSLMSPQTVTTVLDAIAKAWPLSSTIEISLEANPTSVEASRFQGYRTAGVNRVSLGVQALNDPDLEKLGRRHSAREALMAVEIAASIFDRFSFDLIYARPDQTLDAWEAELEQAIGYAAEHLSLYQLTIEPGTAYHALHAAGKLVVPDPDMARALFERTQEVCAAKGLPAYEISNHARLGSECRHNLVYWRSGEYAGIGPGAHGRLKVGGERRALATERHPETWLSLVEAQGHGLVEEEALSAEAQGDEFLLMGLRLREGIDLLRYEAVSGRSLKPSAVDALKGYGFVETLLSGQLRVTAEGLPVLDAVVADLAA